MSSIKDSDNTDCPFWQSDLKHHKGKLIDADNQYELSYPALDEKIELFAKNISGARQLVALVADNSLSFVIAYLALLRYQHVILLIEDPLKQNVEVESAEIKSVEVKNVTLKSSQPATEAINPELSQLSQKNQQLLSQYPINYLIVNDKCVPVNNFAIALHPNLALLLSTSGSTGSSKLVKLSYNNLIANTRDIGNYLPITSDDTVVTTLPLHYSFGLSILQSHLAVGASIVLTNATPLEKSLWQIYKTYQPQSFYGVPFSFDLLNRLQFKRLPLDSVKYFAQAGGKINLDTCQVLSQWCSDHQQQLYLMYGQTEATARIAYLSPNKLPEKSGYIGQAIPNGQLCLRDDNDKKITQVGLCGELCYKGDNVFIGYASSIACLSRAEHIEWLKTGDIATLDSEGDYQIIGRTKRIIKVLGKRISLDDIEAYLISALSKKTSSDLTKQQAINIAVSGQDEQLHIYFDQVGAEPQILLLIEDFTKINSRYITLHYLSELPRLSNGKIAYGQLDGNAFNTKNSNAKQSSKNPELIDLPIYQSERLDKQALMSEHLLDLTAFHQRNCALYNNFINAWVSPKTDNGLKQLPEAKDIPPFAVRHFKEHQLSSVQDEDIFRTLHSSGTTGQPSTIILDTNTAKLQSAVLVKTLQHWLGKARRPMLIIDAPSTMNPNTALTARAAGIRGFSMFGRQHCYALNDDLSLNTKAVVDFFEKHHEQPILIFGFTFIIWQKFIVELQNQKLVFSHPNAILFHGGGWKKMTEQAVSNTNFKASIKACIGNVTVHDYYGMVEQTGTIHIECEQGYLHSPIWSDVLIRRPSDLSLAPNNEVGVVQVNSIIARSYPGHCLLTEDLGMIVGEDDCKCGRKGKYFVIKGRVPSAEKRGCSDTFS